MPPITCKSGPWQVECIAEEGARLSRLSFGDSEFLTPAPLSFVPVAGFGAYEGRPVYGYDDCFPTVDACAFPGRDSVVAPDHGELCWLPWNVKTSTDRLECHAQSRLFPVIFRRTLVFHPDRLEWRFEVENRSSEPFPFLHVMHALMPPARIRGVELPSCAAVLDEATNAPIATASSEKLAADLLATPRGDARMLLLHGVHKGSIRLTFERMRLDILFPVELFPTLGIWWNNSGYPPVQGRERAECAFEPIPGASSSLEKSQAAGRTLIVAPGRTLSWSILWRVCSA